MFIDVFLFISTHILLVLNFPGSVDADVGLGGKLSHLMASCVRNIVYFFFMSQMKMSGMFFFYLDTVYIA